MSGINTLIKNNNRYTYSICIINITENFCVGTHRPASNYKFIRNRIYLPTVCKKVNKLCKFYVLHIRYRTMYYVLQIRYVWFIKVGTFNHCHNYVTPKFIYTAFKNKLCFWRAPRQCPAGRHQGRTYATFARDHKLSMPRA